MHSAAPDHLGNEVVVGSSTLQDLDFSNRLRQIPAGLYVTWRKEESVARYLTILYRPVVISTRAADVAQDVADPMIVAKPDRFARGAANDIDRDRSPRSCCLDPVPREPLNRIMVIRAADISRGSCSAGSVMSEFRHVIASELNRARGDR
jgi:hypothetical protein